MSEEYGPVLLDWSVRVGTFDARVTCPFHAGVTCNRANDVARCPVCNAAVILCLAVYGSKECVMKADHAGAYHTSPSGTSWTDRPVTKT